MNMLALAIGGGIVASGLIIFCILVFFKQKKLQAIEHYEEKRDDITVRTPPKKDDETTVEETPTFNPIQVISSLIGLGLVGVVGFTILENVQSAVSATNSTIQTEIITTSTRLFFPIIAIGGIVVLFFGVMTIFFKE